MGYWKCEICGKEFDNFHAQGFDNKVYCPLCFFKEKTNRLEKIRTQLKEENKRLEENNLSMQEEMVRTWKKLDDLKEIEREHQKTNGDLREELKYTVPIVEHNKIISEKNKEIQQVKEVIEEVREYIDELYDNTDDITCYDIDKNRKEFLLQILDKAKGENNG